MIKARQLLKGSKISLWFYRHCDNLIRIKLHKQIGQQEEAQYRTDQAHRLIEVLGDYSMVLV